MPQMPRSFTELTFLDTKEMQLILNTLAFAIVNKERKTLWFVAQVWNWFVRAAKSLFLQQTWILFLQNLRKFLITKTKRKTSVSVRSHCSCFCEPHCWLLQLFQKSLCSNTSVSVLTAFSKTFRFCAGSVPTSVNTFRKTDPFLSVLDLKRSNVTGSKLQL